MSVTRRDMIAKSLKLTGGTFVAAKILDEFTGHPITGVMPLYATSVDTRCERYSDCDNNFNFDNCDNENNGKHKGKPK